MLNSLLHRCYVTGTDLSDRFGFGQAGSTTRLVASISICETGQLRRSLLGRALAGLGTLE
jgi:hypothetical protein